MKKESTSRSVLTTTSVLLHAIAQWRELHLVMKNLAAWAAAYSGMEPMDQEGQQQLPPGEN